MNKPLFKPHNPRFSSGPTPKHPGWTFSKLENALLGRSHRSPDGQKKLKESIDLTRQILEIPQDYHIAIVPGSTTGAMERALWGLLGVRGVDVFQWDLFGSLWAIDIVEQLQIKDTRVFTAQSGYLPDLSAHTPDRDVVFTWNGTTTGICIPDLDWIHPHREGLSICDATSAAFCVSLDWAKLDAVSFSWQKGLGSEAAHGMIVLSPRAIDRLMTYTPPWPIPRLFRFMKNQELMDDMFQGATINTPSLLCVEDYLQALYWAQSIGGLPNLIQRCQANAQTIARWVARTPWLGYLAKNPHTTSPTSICLEILDLSSHQPIPEKPQRLLIQAMENQLAQEGVAFDIRNHRNSAPSLRLWAGPTIESTNLERLFPWIEWSYENNKHLLGSS